MARFLLCSVLDYALMLFYSKFLATTRLWHCLSMPESLLPDKTMQSVDTVMVFVLFIANFETSILLLVQIQLNQKLIVSIVNDIF